MDCIAWGSDIYGIRQLLQHVAPKQDGAKVALESARTIGNVQTSYRGLS